MVNAKERRIQKSRDRNPLWSGNKKEIKRKSKDEEEISTKRVKVRKIAENELNEKPYTGITGKLGQDKLRSNFKLKSQAELHMRTMKKQKKLTKTIKQLEVAEKAKIKKMQDNMPVRLFIYFIYCVLRAHNVHRRMFKYFFFFLIYIYINFFLHRV